MALIGRVSGVVARPRPPRGALSARVVSTASAPDGAGRRESVCAGRRGGGGGGRAVGRQVEADVQSSTAGDRSCLICIKSDSMIRMVPLTTWIFAACPGEAGLGTVVSTHRQMKSVCRRQCRRQSSRLVTPDRRRTSCPSREASSRRSNAHSRPAPQRARTSSLSARDSGGVGYRGHCISALVHMLLFL